MRMGDSGYKLEQERFWLGMKGKDHLKGDQAQVDQRYLEYWSLGVFIWFHLHQGVSLGANLDKALSSLVWFLSWPCFLRINIELGLDTWDPFECDDMNQRLKRDIITGYVVFRGYLNAVYLEVTMVNIFCLSCVL